MAMRLNIVAKQLLVGLMCLGLGVANALEPGYPTVDQAFSPEKEERISQLAEMSVPDVFKSLKAEEFMAEEEYMNKAIFRAFNGRGAEAVELALTYVRSSQIQSTPEGPQNLYLARKTLEVFPDEALDTLLDLYSNGGPRIRRNVIYVVGEMAGGEPVRALLLHALDDTSPCEEVLPESIGVPLRVCDVAYNQLVIRYKVQGALRSIGTTHKTETRDYHIQKMKKRGI